MSAIQPTAAAQRTASGQPGVNAAAEPDAAYAGYQIIRRNGAVVGFEPNKIAVALTKAFLAVHGTPGRGLGAACARPVDALTEAVVRALLRSQPGRRHLPYRGHPGPGRARPDARRPARSRARLRAVPRTPRAGARRAEAAPATPRRRRCTWSTAASACRWTWRACERWSSRPAPAWATTCEPSRSWPRRAAQPVRRRADGRGRQGRDPGRAHADREGPGLHATSPRGCCCNTIRREVLGEEVTPGRHGATRYAEYFPQFIKRGIARRTARRAAAPVRPRAPGRGARGRARPAVRLPRPADAVRPLFPAHRGAPHRAAAGLLHARGDGAGAERDRPRGARHRVLRRAVDASTS